MRTNLYYKSIVKPISDKAHRQDLSYIYWSGFARKIFQVFTRRNFGERYYSIRHTLKTVILMLLLPALLNILKLAQQLISRHGEPEKGLPSVKGFTTWYIFAIALLIFGILREVEIKRSRSSFDFNKYSLYSGDLVFIGFVTKFYGRIFERFKINFRYKEIFIEPTGFLLVGCLLYFAFGEYLGLLWMVCALLYMSSHAAMYRLGDHFVLDLIDNEIASHDNIETMFEMRSAQKMERRGGEAEDEETASRIASLTMEEEPVFVAK